MPEQLTEWGVLLPDGRVRAFRFREGAEQHVEWLRKTRAYGVRLVSRTVEYADWESTNSGSAPQSGS